MMDGKRFHRMSEQATKAERLMSADMLGLREDDEIASLGQDELPGIEQAIIDRRHGIDASIRALTRLRVRANRIIMKLEAAQGRGPLADWCE